MKMARIGVCMPNMMATYHICITRLSRFATYLDPEVSTAMPEPFPVLTSLWLVSVDVLVLSDDILGGSALILKLLI